MLRETMWRQK